MPNEISNYLPPKSKRQQIGNILSLLAKLRPAGQTDVGRSLIQLAAMLKHASLVMVFSDLLADPEPIIAALRRLRHGGNDVILFHILDEAEVAFPVFRAGGIGRAGDERAAGSGCRQLPPRLLAGDRAVPRDVSPRVLSERHRLRGAGYEHAVRRALTEYLIMRTVAGDSRIVYHRGTEDTEKIDRVIG